MVLLETLQTHLLLFTSATSRRLSRVPHPHSNFNPQNCNPSPRESDFPIWKADENPGLTEPRASPFTHSTLLDMKKAKAPGGKEGSCCPDSSSCDTSTGPPLPPQNPHVDSPFYSPTPTQSVCRLQVWGGRGGCFCSPASLSVRPMLLSSHKSLFTMLTPPPLHCLPSSGKVLGSRVSSPLWDDKCCPALKPNP